MIIDEAKLNKIKDPEAREVIRVLSNLYEDALVVIQTLKIENQKLRDENNRLKGEQGKPDVKPSKKQPEQKDLSSEKERKEPKIWIKNTKNDKLTITRTVEPLPMKVALPADAVFKGQVDVVYQDLKLVAETICVKRNKYYSPSTGKTYYSPLPVGMEGAFGANLKTLLLGLHHIGNMSEKAMHTLVTHAGILISTGQISNLLIKSHEALHQEKQDIALAGLKSAPWQQTDDTLTRVNGVNYHCHVLENPFYSSYMTLPRKDRLSVLDVFRNGAARVFLFTQQILESAFVLNLPAKWRKTLGTLPLDTLWDESSLLELMEEKFPTLAVQQRKGLVEQMALAAYRNQTVIPVIDLLICDDAPQFCGLTRLLSLCWVHAGRHFKKLSPHLPCHQERLSSFKKKFWSYYRKLLAYKCRPTSFKAAILEKQFDALFIANTGYEALDDRIRKTAANKTELLHVLQHPEIPLHNNASELAVRRRVRKRDASFGPRTKEGVRAWDTFHTIVGTAQKHNVSILAYLADRLSKEFKMPSLASMITSKAAEMNLSRSWS